MLAALMSREREERINALEVLLVLALFCQPDSSDGRDDSEGDDHVGQVKLAFTMFDSDLSGTMSMVRHGFSTGGAVGG